MRPSSARASVAAGFRWAPEILALFHRVLFTQIFVFVFVVVRVSANSNCILGKWRLFRVSAMCRQERPICMNDLRTQTRAKSGRARGRSTRALAVFSDAKGAQAYLVKVPIIAPTPKAKQAQKRSTWRLVKT